MYSNKKYETTTIVHLLALKGEQILLLERQNTGTNDGLFGLIAGHKEHGEAAIDAIVREAKEEIGISLQKDDIEFVHALVRRRSTHPDERIDLFFTARKWLGTPSNNEPEKHGDPTWFPLENLPEKIVPFVRTAVEGYQSKNTFTDFLER